MGLGLRAYGLRAWRRGGGIKEPEGALGRIRNVELYTPLETPCVEGFMVPPTSAPAVLDGHVSRKVKA